MNSISENLKITHSSDGDIIDKLVIHGVGFKETGGPCFKKHLLQEIGKTLPISFITNEISQEADVLIINLDSSNTVRILEKQLPQDNCFVILIVHDITRNIFPFMKLADHVIFINELQQVLCEGFLYLEYDSTVLPYPFGETIKTKEDNSDCFIYFEGDGFAYEDSHYEERMQLSTVWYSYNGLRYYYFFFEVPEEHTARFEAFKQRNSRLDPRFLLFNTNKLSIEDLFLLMSKCFCGHVFKHEITLEQYLTALEQRESWILHDVLSESPILAAMQHAQLFSNSSIEKTFFNFNYKNKSTSFEWAEAIKQIIRQKFISSRFAKNELEKTVAIDKLENLNIVLGKPLSNDYVFSVCFRNQEEKIIRCLQSLINQDGQHDFGVVLVSDCSTDCSIEKIIKFAQGISIDICLVDNKERKFASKNFYNVAHSLVTNDESVIIEVDGDDFLSGSHVLDTLDVYYKAGALKTNGSYTMYPENQIFSTESEVEFHHKNYDIFNPWSLKCTSWLHLRTAKRHLICQVELKYFLERKTKQWLVDTHDSAIQPRIIELAKDKAIFVKEILYCYDVSGDFHDHAENSPDEKILHSYRKMDKIYHPISYTDH